ncbi:TRAP transporter large permease [Seohaeicola zhoushanensis]|uniref:TRAP transporter large permease protein n=1 Tax=Seohaeicola zhoushanensis TaxID=1569283 RepID=A0A8J3H1H7_9RHOB|nr:TRAP transporter large permease [Seohaeicola zhoushanensis]GHF67166.1 C4-dicarboxylate ABC transporter [Seohaeicola zhoushanensis]
MSDPQLGVLLIGVLLVLIALRVPIGAALVAVPFVGIWLLFGWRPAIGALKVIPYNFAASWQLSSVPMFLMMGFLAYHTGITRGLFNAARMWLARLPGGLAVASIFGAAGFASVTGSSVACAAAMGRIAVPEMTRQGYDDRLATGTVAAAGTIGALIPPSILLIIYGIIAQVPISPLFVGAVGAGLLTTVSYVLVVTIWATVNPAIAPRVEEHYSWPDRLRVLISVGPILLLALLVFGGLFAGIFTPTEAGAVGAVLCTLIALFNRALTWDRFRVSLIETFTTTAAIFVIAIGANLLGRFVTLTGADDYIAAGVLGLASNTAFLLAGIVLLYLVLGMFLDPLGAMLLTLPILLPVAREVGFDLLWFGVILAKLLEIGMITPPIGLNVFVIKNVVGDRIGVGRIFQGVTYFLLADFVVVVLLMAFPAIVLFLPGLVE